MQTLYAGQMGLFMLLCYSSIVTPFHFAASPLLKASKALKTLESARCRKDVISLRKPSALRMGFFDTIIKSVGLPVQKDGPQTVSIEENEKIVQQYMKRVEEQITPLEAKIEKLSDAELKAKTDEFRSRLQVVLDFHPIFFVFVLFMLQ